MDRPGFSARLPEVLERLRTGTISRRQAARELEVGYASLLRILDAQPGNQGETA